MRAKVKHILCRKKLADYLAENNWELKVEKQGCLKFINYRFIDLATTTINEELQKKYWS